MDYQPFGKRALEFLLKFHGDDEEMLPSENVDETMASYFLESGLIEIDKSDQGMLYSLSNSGLSLYRSLLKQFYEETGRILVHMERGGEGDK